MFYRLLLLFVLLLPTGKEGMDKKYEKQYYSSGELKAEGWLQNKNKEGFWKFYYKNNKIAEQGHFKVDKKEKYWYFYSPNGTPVKEGHYTKNKKMGWWLFYSNTGRINHKCQLLNNVKNGFCLRYENEKLTSAEKYKNGKKIKEWYSFVNFKKENNISDLK